MKSYDLKNAVTIGESLLIVQDNVHTARTFWMMKESMLLTGYPCNILNALIQSHTKLLIAFIQQMFSWGNEMLVPMIIDIDN